MNYSTPHPERNFAAVFVDFENLYYFLYNEFDDPANLNDAILEALRNLREQLKSRFQADSIVINAYADFERLSSSPQGQLFLLGVDTKNVLGTEHKNAADMRLCIDAMEILYTRPEISTFVLVAGDRDYIPLIQHLRRQAKQVLGSGFLQSTSGDLRLNLGADSFFDVRQLIEDTTWEKMVSHREIQRQLRQLQDEKLARQAQELRETASVRTAFRAPEIAPEVQTAPPPAPTFSIARDIDDPDQLRCLSLILEEMQRGHFSELWLGPFLRDMTDAMPDLADYQRRRLISDLARNGAIAVEKRDGDPFPFSVIVVNYNHASVRHANSLNLESATNDI